MTEVDFTAMHVADLTHGKGRGMKLIGCDLTLTDSETLTTGLSEISGVSYVVESAAVNGDLPLLFVKSVSGGTITFLFSEVGTYTNMTDREVRVMAMGVLR